MENVSPITNRWGEVERRRVAAEHRVIFRGGEGCAFSHNPQIQSMEGRLYATWANGPLHEDDPGQQMVLSTSDDAGESWSDAVPIVPRQPGKYADAVVTGQGIRVYERTLVAYYGQYEYLPEGIENGHRTIVDKAHTGTQCRATVSEDAGRTWSEPVLIVERLMPNLSPQPTASGRLILPGYMLYPYTDDPAGLTGWQVTGLSGLPEDYVDDSEGHRKGAAFRGTRHYCEGSFFQTDDGVLHMMLRTSDYCLAVTESRDDGETWSEPVMTDYTDCQSRHQFGRLADGRFFGLSCPEPGSERTPLVLATSDDGVVFDRHYILGDEPSDPPRMPGIYKIGRYGYPHMEIMDQAAFVIYSVSKEDIALCRFSLSELA